MSALLKHIEKQQSIAMNLCGVIEALAILDNEGVGANAITSLLNVAGDLANQLNDGLDSVRLPEVGA